MKNALFLRILCIAVATPILLSVCSCADSSATGNASSNKSSMAGSLLGSSIIFWRLL